MAGDLQLSARQVANLLAHIFGPSFYDGPHYGHGHLVQRGIREVAGPHPEPWQAVALNPQPLPPGAAHALALADVHITEVISLDRVGALLGGEATDRSLGRALQLVADVDELCPRWPHWPRGSWPPPPPPPPWWNGEMTSSELFMFGSRILAAADAVESEKLQAALVSLGEKALGLSMQQG